MTDPACHALKSNEDLATELSALISDAVDDDRTKNSPQKLD
jgi:hypothetical protein